MTVEAPESTETNEIPQGGTQGAPQPQNGSEGQKGNREARYRVERNEARTALAAAQARIEALQTREVHRLAEELAQPSDLLELGGVSLADLMDDNGEVDPEAVVEAVAALIEARPGLAKNPRQRAVDPSQGLGNGTGKRAPTFADLFKS
ncbi:hypothetical protein A5646_20495 [Mycobacterium sp. 1245499.0]|uniref:hypothetical protein n=1 Tax=Mycobacterium sp. 1245499.0 TaxID=1834074 RepID=UPI00080225C1|nr:hypothetical protein [Mycobacterium sp. 1245499.0]OBL00871.1 hypothetical protein A5646_20495 [Mycobacterium sp. 1245499.0]